MAVMQLHPFERAGYGHAPYRFVGLRETVFRASPDSPIQPATTCDYCGTGITLACLVRSADGVEFKVGRDCVRHAYAAIDATIPADFRAAFLAVERQKVRTRRESARARLVARAQRVRAILEAAPAMFADRRDDYLHALTVTNTHYLKGGDGLAAVICDIVEAAVAAD